MSGPIQYIDGFVEFCGIKLAIDSRALIPRFETEFLVKKTIDWCTKKNLQKNLHIADIGTGSGNIAVSLALNLPKAHLTAVDISPKALSLAQENAHRQNVSDRIYFILGDLLTSIRQPLDIIVANLPYIPSERIPYLDPDVKDFEPHLALDGGLNGFYLYNRLFNQISNLPELPKLCVIEIDENQKKMANREIHQHFPSAIVNISKDSSELFRYATIEFAPN